MEEGWRSVNTWKSRGAISKQVFWDGTEREVRPAFMQPNSNSNSKSAEDEAEELRQSTA